MLPNSLRGIADLCNRYAREAPGKQKKPPGRLRSPAAPLKLLNGLRIRIVTRTALRADW